VSSPLSHDAGVGEGRGEGESFQSLSERGCLLVVSLILAHRTHAVFNLRLANLD